MIMDEKVKIEKLMQDLGMNSAQFAIEIGIQGSTLSHILNGRNKPSLDVLKKILNRFRIINPEWLILGIGSMYQQEKHSQAPTLFDSIDGNNSKSDTLADKLAGNNSSRSSSIQTEKVKLEAASKIETKETKNNISLEQTLTQIPNTKLVKRIIVYYDDNTFQEFESKSQ